MTGAAVTAKPVKRYDDDRRYDSMAQLAPSFRDAEKNINPSADDVKNAPLAHEEVRGVLADDETLKEWKIDPILIGSYARDVAIRRVKDVDMFCRLRDLPDGTTAKTVYDHIEGVLRAKYDSVTRNARSIEVEPPGYDGLYVDVVAARRAGDRWEIPTAEGEWQETNPTEMTDLKTEMNERHDGNYVPLVKFVRQTRRALLDVSKPGGLAVEMALYTACDEGLALGEGRAEQFASALEGVADVFERVANDGFEIPDPSMPGETLTFRATDKEWKRAAAAFRDAATDAREASEMSEDDQCKAALLDRDVLGGNDDHHHVFPMPAGCNDDGTAKASLSTWRRSGDRSVPAGDGRFAS